MWASGPVWACLSEALEGQSPLSVPCRVGALASDCFIHHGCEIQANQKQWAATYLTAVRVLML